MPDGRFAIATRGSAEGLWASPEAAKGTSIPFGAIACMPMHTAFAGSLSPGSWSAARFDEPFLQGAALRADRFQHNARLRRHEERQAAYDGQKNGAKAKHTSGLEAESGENGANAILRCDAEVAVVL